jgi:hypothetical protein
LHNPVPQRIQCDWFETPEQFSIETGTPGPALAQRRTWSKHLNVTLFKTIVYSCRCLQVLWHLLVAMLTVRKLCLHPFSLYNNAGSKYSTGKQQRVLRVKTDSNISLSLT